MFMHLNELVVRGGLCVAQQSVRKKTKNFFMKKVQKFTSLKTVGTNILPEVCFLLNLQNGFKNPARKSASC